MSDFISIIKDFDSMCQKNEFYHCLGECPIARLIDTWEREHKDTWVKDCIYFALECPRDFEEAIIEWRRSIDNE